MNAKVRMGMVGGGKGSFIGAIHRMAAALDGDIALVAGCFSSNPERSTSSARMLGLPELRNYANYQQMVIQEAQLPIDERMQFVAIVTPNHLHFPIATAALQAGFHVLSDKPATASLEQAIQLRETVQASGKLYGLTHTYAAYPLIRQARAMILSGEIGTVRRVAVAYPQGWLAHADDTTANKQALWRTNAATSGESGCFADIGTHAHHLAEYVTGLTITDICADLATVVDGRELDDDGAALFRMENGARGSLIASQICAGEGNGLHISVYGENASLCWQQQQPNSLQVKRRGCPVQLYAAGADCDYLEPEVRASCRTPRDHPEGYIEAFANIYRDFAAGVRQRDTAEDQELALMPWASIEQGVRGMAFVRAAIESSHNNACWVSLQALSDSFTQ